MRIIRIITLGVAAVLIGTTAQALDTYRVDPAHTSVNFSIEHMVINTVHGRFRQFEGSITVDPDNGNALKGASGTIQAKSIDTDIERRDNHLRSSDFFDVEKFPTITFESTEVRKDGSDQVLVGKFTMHGVTKDVSLPFKLKGPIKGPMGNMIVGLEVNAKLNRKDYGLTWNKAIEAGGLMVGEDVTIQINAELVKQAVEKK
ncbi:MAG: YceI family protein [Verrucomicrobiia bacterium]|jgi:polyisoprenoid-binding protein YceI